MKLFVWDEELLHGGYGAGMLCILTNDLEEARRLSPGVLLRVHNGRNRPFEEYINDPYSGSHYWERDCAFVLANDPTFVFDEPGGIALMGTS